MDCSRGRRDFIRLTFSYYKKNEVIFYYILYFIITFINLKMTDTAQKEAKSTPVVENEMDDFQKAIHYTERQERLNCIDESYIDQVNCLSEYIRKITKEQIDWLKNEADNNNSMAMNCLAVIYLYDDANNDILSIKKGMKYLNDAINQNNSIAMYNLSNVCLSSKHGNGTDLVKSFEWLKASSEKGNPFSLHWRAHASHVGHGTEVDLEDAFIMYVKSAKYGSIQSQYVLGKWYSKGIFVQKDEAKAIKWLSKAIDNTDNKKDDQYRDAMFDLAQIYFDKPEHKDKGIKMLDELARKHNDMLSIIILEQYYHNMGDDRAIEYCKLQMKNEWDTSQPSYSLAKRHLADFYMKYHGDDEEKVKIANEYYEELADCSMDWSNHPKGLHKMIDKTAIMYTGIKYYKESNYEKALKYFDYLKKIKMPIHDKTANKYLGIMYYYGRGVSVDYKRAYEHLLDADRTDKKVSDLLDEIDIKSHASCVMIFLIVAILVSFAGIILPQTFNYMKSFDLHDGMWNITQTIKSIMYGDYLW